jgi:hypothetical protein
MSAPASKVMSAKISASVQSGDASSLLRISLMVGGAVLLVLLLVFLYKKFVAKKPKNEYFENNEYFNDPADPAVPVDPTEPDADLDGPDGPAELAAAARAQAGM